MNKTVFILVIIVIASLFLSFLGILIYGLDGLFNEDKEIGYTNVSVYALDSSNDYVKTGYKIYLDDIFYEEDVTNSKGPKRIRLAVNKSVEIISSNIEEQNYYSNIVSFRTRNNSIHRAEIRLYEPGKFIIEQIEKNQDINLNVSTDKTIKNAGFCVKWSTHFVYVKPREYTLNDISKLKRFEDYDKCYGTKKDINQSVPLELDFKYVDFGDINSEDYIKIAFFDGVKNPSGGIDYEENIGNKDKIYEININNI